MSIQTPISERRKMQRSFEKISPFEFKNELIRLAKEHEQKSMRAMLDAGRGNPNWIAAAPREAFFALGHFAVQESRRIWDEGALAGKPRQDGIAHRFKLYLTEHQKEPGMQLLDKIVFQIAEEYYFNTDEWLFELVDGIIGDNYPEPDRMLVHVEKIVHSFLLQELCQGNKEMGSFQLFAVEGATAAMCYIFDTLRENELLSRGDKIAIMTPIFPPYVEIPKLARYEFDVVEIRATGMTKDGMHTWQYPDTEIEKLSDSSIRALFLVNPSNPPSVAMEPKSIAKLVTTIKNSNPNLMIISDDVYSTFVDGYRSLMMDLPFNTIGVYSFSKYFGVTGWRLGVIAVHEENVFDAKLQNLSKEKKEFLHHRYTTLSQHPAEIRFIDRLVADSRQVALNHTAGLSTPQQVQMALFCAFALLDKKNEYQELTKAICRRRMYLLYQGLDLPEPKVPYGAYYYTEFDLEEWARHHYGQDFFAYLKNHYEPIDILFRLAAESSIVLLNGGGFRAPRWSIRVSLANLEDQAYSQIGKELHHALQKYVEEWKSSEKQSGR